MLALRRARVLIDDFHRVRLPTVPYRHALYAWVPPSPDATCALPKGVRDPIVLRYLLTYLKERDGARRAAELTRTDFASLARVPIGCLSNRPRRPCTPSQARSSLILRLRFTAIKLLLCLVVHLIVHLLLVALLVLHSA